MNENRGAETRSRRVDLLIACLLVFVTFAVYARTLAPDVVDADGGEFQFAAWSFSLAHPTGYPLFLILGGAFQHLLPIGNPAYRLNLFTALTASLAIATLYIAAYELTRQRLAAAVAALALAFTRVFWFDAGAAEVYDLNAFFVALLVFLALRWQARPTGRLFQAFCLVFGLSLTHHRTILLWLPALAIFFAAVAIRSRNTDHAPRTTHHVLRRASYALLLLALPLLLYLYLPLRAPASPYAVLSLSPDHSMVLYDNSVQGWFSFVTGKSFESELLWDATSLARLAMLPESLFDQFGIVGIAFGVLGALTMIVRKSFVQLVLLVIGALTMVLFASLYHIGDIVHYYIPVHLVWALWIGVGIAQLAKVIDGRRLPADRQEEKASQSAAVKSLQSALLVFAVAAVLLVPQFVSNLPSADRSGETRAREYWTNLLAASIPENAILVSNDRDEMMPLWYMQYVENTRRDLSGLFPRITSDPQYSNVARLVDSALESKRPVFLIKPMPGLEIKYRLKSLQSPVVQVLGQAAGTRPQFSSNAELGDDLRIVGYDVERKGNVLQAVIFWQPIRVPAYDYVSFVHLIDARGNKVAQGNDHKAGGEYYPTTLWQVGQLLRDEHEITLPPNVTAGEYRLLVGMYRASDMEPLAEPAEIGKIDLQ